MLKCIGKKIVAIKGFHSSRRKPKVVEPCYILFDDNKTFIELEEQDYYTYHDCSSSARTITTREDERMWKIIMDNESGNYPAATVSLF